MSLVILSLEYSEITIKSSEAQALVVKLIHNGIRVLRMRYV